MLATFIAITSLAFQNPTWDELQAPYAYHHLDFSQVSESQDAASARIGIQFSFPSPSGDTVHGILVEPANPNHVPCVLLLHGLGDNKENLEKKIGAALLAKGIAYAAI